jgi:DNA-binding IclR family transcriptional regulator
MKDTQVGQKVRKSQRRIDGVQVIARAAEILWALSRYPEGTNLKQLTREVHLPPSTVHRILNALESARFVAFTSSAGYIQLGVGVAVLADSVPSDPGRELRPYLKTLVGEVGEAVTLGVLQNDKVLFLEHIEALHRLRAFSAVGLAFPLHSNANGKAILALLAKEEVERLIPAQLEPLTPNTVTQRSRLLKELETVKSERVAFDREEHTLGVCAVGSALRDPIGRLAAISVVVPSVRFYGNEQKLASTLLKHLDIIEREWADPASFLAASKRTAAT